MKKHFFALVILLLCLTNSSLLAQDHTAPVVMQPASNARTGGNYSPGASSTSNNNNYSRGNSNTNYNSPSSNGYYNSDNYYGDLLRNRNYFNQVEAFAKKRFFYNENYHTGELWTKNGHYLKEMMYRIDQVEGAIQVKLLNGKELFVDEKSIIMFHLFLKGQKFVFVTRNIPNKRDNALLQMVYYSPKFQLLRDSRKLIVETLVTDKKKTTVKDEGVKTIPSSNLRIHQAFEDDIKNDFRYYITEDDNKPLKEIQLNEAGLSQIFPDHMTTIVQFFKDNAIKDELDQVKLVKLLDKITLETNSTEKK